MDPRDRNARDEETSAKGEAGAARGEGWKLLVSWLVVGIPAAWGVAQVVVKSLALVR